MKKSATILSKLTRAFPRVKSLDRAALGQQIRLQDRARAGSSRAQRQLNTVKLDRAQGGRVGRLQTKNEALQAQVSNLQTQADQVPGLQRRLDTRGRVISDMRDQSARTQETIRQQAGEVKGLKRSRRNWALGAGATGLAGGAMFSGAGQSEPQFKYAGTKIEKLSALNRLLNRE